MPSSVSIVIPARNEAENIPVVLRDVKAAVAELGQRSVEIVVVDDGSTDGTAELAAKAGAKIVINNGPQHGKGYALQTGFAASESDFVVMMDADCSHRAEDIPALVRKLDEGAGMVIASRQLGGSDEYTHVRMFGNILITGLFNLFFGTKLTDAINGFKAFRRDVLRGRSPSSTGFEIEVELVANALKKKMAIAEVPSHERARFKGQVKSRTLIDGSRFILKVLKEGIKYKLGLN